MASFTRLRGTFIGVFLVLTGCGKEPGLENSPDAGGPSSIQCEGNADCDTATGLHCVDGTCVGTCTLHEHCLAGSCTGSAVDEGGVRVSLCEADEFPHSVGQFGTSCVRGPGDCDSASGFGCVGAGEGDLDAYCSTTCGGEADCPAGYTCADDLTGDVPCEDVCAFSADNAAPGCIPTADIGEGETFRCGVLGLLRRECRKREFCNPCDSDADCRARPGQICARDQSGAKICTTLCALEGDTCPWGTAGACGVWDEELGEPTCGHAAGSCVGDGTSCQPCIADVDCPGGACTRSTYTGEKYCLDLEPSCTCPEDTATSCRGGGCPVSPGGLEMTCFGGEGAMESVLYNHCWGAESDPQVAGSAPGCWPGQ